MNEVLIVGSGPAGSTAAIALRQRGRQVRILERSHHPRTKLCAGGLPPKVIGTLPVDLSGLVQQVAESIRFRFQGKQELVLNFERPVIHMVCRDELDRRLAETAVRMGATLDEGIQVLHLAAQKDCAVAMTNRGDFQAQAIIAADGALGAGSRLLGRKGIRLCPAVQAEIRVSEKQMNQWSGRLGCDFGVVPGGIGWVFPKKDFLSVGACTFWPPVNLRAALEQLVLSEGIEPVGSIEIKAHPLPVWDGRKKFSQGVILLAGDAAGLVNPLTGAGIRRACISGQLAAEAVHAYLAGGARCQRDLSGYDRLINQALVGELVRARILSQLFYRAAGFFYQLGVMNSRVNPWVEQLLSGQKSYLEIFQEIITGRWCRREGLHP